MLYILLAITCLIIHWSSSYALQSNLTLLRFPFECYYQFKDKSHLKFSFCFYFPKHKLPLQTNGSVILAISISGHTSFNLGPYTPSLQQRYFECPHSSAPVFLQKHTSFQPTAFLPWPARVIFIPVSFAVAAHLSTVFS